MRCSARRKYDGGQCANSAIRGASVCRMHGGSAPQTRRRAAARVAEQRATEALSREGVLPVENPLEALRLLAGEVLQVKEFLGRRVEVLEELRYRGVGGEQLRGELSAYERALDRSVRVLSEIARLNIDERLVQIDRTLAALVEQLIQSTLQVVGFLPPLEGDGDRDLVRQVFAHVLKTASPVEGHRLPPGISALSASFPPELQERIDRVRERVEGARELPALRARVQVLEAELAVRRSGAVRAPLELEAGSPAPTTVAEIVGQVPAVVVGEVVEPVSTVQRLGRPERPCNGDVDAEGNTFCNGCQQWVPVSELQRVDNPHRVGRPAHQGLVFTALPEVEEGEEARAIGGRW